MGDYKEEIYNLIFTDELRYITIIYNVFNS